MAFFSVVFIRPNLLGLGDVALFHDWRVVVGGGMWGKVISGN